MGGTKEQGKKRTSCNKNKKGEKVNFIMASKKKTWNARRAGRLRGDKKTIKIKKKMGGKKAGREETKHDPLGGPGYK